MNIFYLSDKISECVEWQVNRHCSKMPLESVQLLCTAHRVLDGTLTTKKVFSEKTSKYRNKKVWSLPDERDLLLYDSISNYTHVSAIWARTSSENYKWLHELATEQFKEYTYRYGKIHKCEQIGLLDLLKTPPKNIPIGEFTQPTPAMDQECIVPGDSVASYRKYYIDKKQHLADWSGKINGRPVPEWYIIK